MASQLLSIPPQALEQISAAAAGESVGLAAREFAGVERGETLYGVWQDEVGQPIDDRFEIGRVERVMLEHPSGDGGFGRTEVARAAPFLAETPDAAAYLALGVGDGPAAVRIQAAELSASAEALPAPRTELVGPPGSRFVFPVISERFPAWEPFLARVRELRNWIVGQPPFNEAAVAAALGVKAIFWASDAAVGMFGADDSRAPPDGQLFYGNQALAKQLIDPWLGAPVRASLILINSAFRGGAGGSPGYSAWASIAGGQGDWQAVGLHEIGHALGLGDEYLLPSLAGQNPAVLEPNISRVPTAGQAPWSDRITVAPTASPSHDLHHQTGAPTAIGTFQGARYRTDFYRPMQNCLMKDTRFPFCRICRDHIRATI